MTVRTGQAALRPMTLDHYEAVTALWQTAPGVGLSKSDSRQGLARFLERNPGLSFVALAGDEVVGAVLCGHDGRRGYIHHLTVSAPHRRRGVGRDLVAHCLVALNRAGIDKCHLFVFAANQEAQRFWHAIGSLRRDELVIFSLWS